MGRMTVNDDMAKWCWVMMVKWWWNGGKMMVNDGEIMAEWRWWMMTKWRQNGDEISKMLETNGKTNNQINKMKYIPKSDYRTKELKRSGEIK